MNSIEISAKTISEAVENGASKLGVDLSEVEYKVINEGSKGFLGLGIKLAKVKVWIKGTEEEIVVPKVKEEKKEIKKELKKEVKEIKKEVKEAKKEETKVIETPLVTAPEADVVERVPLTEEDKSKIIEISKKFLNEVFNSMGIKIEVEAKLVDNKQLNINMNGDNMGVIIGKRGQTLDSLQYLTNLVVNKGDYPYLNVTLDTESYRQRRKETLENLAFNLAKKCKHIKKNVVLEPMNPYERRIIHSTLQHDRFVTTYSEGVEPYRYVVITLKNNQNKH